MPGVVRSETQGGGMGVHDDEEARKAAKKTAKKAAKKAAREAESTSDADSDADRAARRGAQKKKKRASDSDSDSEPVKVVKKLKGASGEAVPKERGDPKPVRMSVAEFRRSQGIMVTGGADACPDPFQTFEDSGYMPELLKAVKEQGFTAPSAIQSQVSCSFGARGVHVCARPPAASCAECRDT